MRNAEEPPSPGGLLPASPGRVLFVRMLLLFVGAAGLALVIRLWRPASGTGALLALDPAKTRIRVAAHGAIITTIDAMLADPDARTAIIGAYARLLEELEGIGAHRRAYEGPTEHLRRVLSMLEVGPRPLRTLVRLFEVARFSEQSLTAVHREEALAALRETATFLTTPAGAHSTSGVVK